jgi:two-component system sensor histidine kinase BarA
LFEGDRRRIANALKGIGSIPEIRHVRVSDNAGKVVFQFGIGVLLEGEHEASLGEQRAPASVLWGTLQTYPVASGVVHGGNRIGTLTIIADISSLRHALLDSLLAALVAGAACAAAGILVTIRLQRRLTSPILALTSAMRDVRDTKDFRRTVDRTTTDEIGALVDAFNDMLREVNSRDIALARHRDRLEEEVAERTRELVAAKQAADSANRAKSDFLATMSHEIRTPMNGMLVMAELLAGSKLEPRARRYCDVIMSSGRSLVSIINDILDFSKIEAGQMALESVPVETARTVDEVLRLFSERASTAGLDLAGYIAPDVPQTIAGDPVRLMQILSNLVNNALKFTKDGGVLVRVERLPAGDTAHAGCMLQFSVIDTGIGIPEGALATLFDAFTQAEQSTTRRFGGTGIGLAICRRLVSAMGGELTVDSTVGQGSTFSFRIPVEAVATGDETTASPSLPREHAGTAALVMPDGPTATALIWALADLGIEAALTGEAESSATLQDRFADGDHRMIIFGTKTVPDVQRRLSASCPVLVVSRFGDSDAVGLVERGLADAVLEQPVGGVETRALLARALGGIAALAQDRDTQGAAATRSHASFRGVHVLAADDSAINREVLGEALARLDVEVTSVDSGLAALEAFKAGSFDLVFMDGSMPEMDGFAAARAIREWEAGNDRSQTPIVALTAHVIGRNADAWREAGMQDYVTKPFTLATIADCLARWIEAPATARDDSRAAWSEPATEASTEDLAGTGDCHTSGVGERDVAPVLDPSVLESIAAMQGPGSTLPIRIIDLFVKHAPSKLDDLMAAPANDNGAALGAAAHALKSMCLNVGAGRLAELCEEIELGARSGVAELDDPRRTLLSSVLSETMAALSDHRRAAAA